MPYPPTINKLRFNHLFAYRLFMNNTFNPPSWKNTSQPLFIIIILILVLLIYYIMITTNPFLCSTFMRVSGGPRNDYAKTTTTISTPWQTRRTRLIFTAQTERAHSHWDAWITVLRTFCTKIVHKFIHSRSQFIYCHCCMYISIFFSLANVLRCHLKIVYPILIYSNVHIFSIKNIHYHILK